eukprot:GFUD01041109.1.p1 GENE.GFUD01041109.1~~GFUD01041109.1.p1  ORF type:complete len:191 (-),score=77.37 GFUD01041109.1:92-664(-)
MSRSKPNILVTGTPGVGKSKLADVLAQKLGMKVINVGQFAKENNCLGDWDPDYESHELDEDPLLDLLEEKVGKGDGGFVLEHHVPELFPERWFDLVLVLRCNNTVLYDRLKERGYGGKKLEENCQAEIFQTVLDEAKESYREEIVVELQSEVEEQVEENVNRVSMWVDQWQQDREKVRPGKRRAEGELEK